MFLPYINVWLALTFEVHQHYQYAKDWFDQNSETGIVFCRFTQAGFLRLATNSAIFKDEALTLAEAWSIYDFLTGDQRIDFSNEPLGTEHLWREMTMRNAYSPKVWNDAYLAAFTRAGDFNLVTFDRGFVQYKKLSCTFLGDIKEGE